MKQKPLLWSFYTQIYSRYRRTYKKQSSKNSYSAFEKKTSFFGFLWYKIRIICEGISYLQSPARFLIFWLQTDTYESDFFNEVLWSLQTKGLQSYKLSKFTKTGEGPRASLEHNDFM